MTDTQTKSQAQHLSTADFDEKLQGAGAKPVMVDFFAEWCGPCKLAAPIIDELSGEYDGKAHIYKVDVDADPELAQRYGVMSIPTVIMFKNGEVATQQVGFPGKAGFVQMLDKALGSK
jgi:thioredoxin 1